MAYLLNINRGGNNYEEKQKNSTGINARMHYVSNRAGCMWTTK